ncbi:MAG TPA: hypothetical protein VK831_01685 [Candidatus Deferrimicrobiaceae bacterium]|nr:hypothetical protein [Candidatus Deferrimicrobiaceae bacterium]
MIRAILHLIGDQPLAVELDAMPNAGDTTLICRNVRTVDGKRPVFIDHTESTFVFPYDQVRFVEIPVEGEHARAEPTPAAEAESEDLEIDEDFLRRIREA